MNAIAKFEKKNMAVFEALADITKEKKALEEKERALKEDLLRAMEKYNVVSFDNDIIKISYVGESESVSIDTKALRAAEPETYPAIEMKYSKRTVRKPYIRFSVK